MITYQKREPVVLFVDDEIEICKNLARLIKPSGYETLYTTNPEQAIAIAEKTEIDIVVLDYMMPEMNGNELIRRLVKIDPRILCIMLTAYGNVPTCNEAYQSGVVRFLEKPIKATVLKKLFKELLYTKKEVISPLAEIARLVNDFAQSEGTEPLVSGEISSMEDFKDEATKRYLIRVTNLCKGNVKDIAKMTKLTVPSIYRLLSLHSINTKDCTAKEKKTKDRITKKRK